VLLFVLNHVEVKNLGAQRFGNFGVNKTPGKATALWCKH
jgi:hypothetical protein